MEPIEASKAVYELLVAGARATPPRIRTWTGDTWGPPDSPATLVLNHPSSLRSMLVPPTDLAAGEAYVFGDVDIEGDILALLEFAASLRQPTGAQKWQLLKLLRALPPSPEDDRERTHMRGLRHSIRRDRQAVSHHYDTGNQFFETFLDPAMVYSCGYFLDPDEPLDAAQERKLDVVCRKLQLEPGDEMLDVGCGWGALAMHAAERYGAHVVGITLSSEQATYAEKAVSERGLTGRVEIRLEDYRELSGSFDKIASIGMFEHVGRSRLSTYFQRLRELLRPGGLVLNHSITTRDRAGQLRRRRTFVNTHVFPDGELLPVEVLITEAERNGFEARDAESLRMSYARTLRCWVANIERNAEPARAAASDRAYRMWRLYMAGSAIAFERGDISVYQVVLADPHTPWTYGRSHMLAADDRSPDHHRTT